MGCCTLPNARVAILTIARLCRSEYELHHHAIIARMLGMSPAAIDAIVAGETERLGPEDRLIARFAEQIKRDGRASGFIVSALQDWLSPAQLIELSVVCGYYMLAAAFLATFDVEIETEQRPIPSREAHIRDARSRESG